MDEATVHLIDPDADTVINLRISHKQCAPLPVRPTSISSSVQPDNSFSDNVSGGNRTKANTGTKLGAEDTHVLEGRHVQYYVSSKHLILASRWFKRSMSNKSFTESGRDKDNLYHISATDWEEDTFLFFMHALHFRHRQIPRPVTLETLAKVALIADYYECEETLGHLAELWASDAKIKNDVPKIYCRDLVLWIWVSWVFKLDNVFKLSTQTMLKQLDKEKFVCWGLPIPDRILDELKDRRIQTIGSILGHLDDWRRSYASDSYLCPYSQHPSSCGAMLLGSLDRHMRKHGLSDPRPEAPFDGISISSLHHKIRTVTVPKWNQNLNSFSLNGHPCNFAASVVKMVEDVTNGIKGLSISEYI